jgi:CHAD domain-containing protein
MDLQDHTPLSMAFATVITHCTNLIVVSTAILRANEDSDALHQLRVGLRRLRTALTAFRDGLQAGPLAKLKSELRWLQDETTSTRDWQVCVGESLSRIAASVRSPDLPVLTTLALAQLDVAEERCRKLLDNPRFHAFLLLLQEWKRHPEQCFLAEGEALRPYVHRVLTKARKQLKRLYMRLSELDVAELHGLRIRVKRLRYMTELFETLGRRKAVHRYVGELKQLQHHLGAIHDAVIAQDLIVSLRGSTDGCAHAVGLVQGWCAAVIESERGALLANKQRVGKPPY